MGEASGERLSRKSVSHFSLQEAANKAKEEIIAKRSRLRAADKSSKSTKQADLVNALKEANVTTISLFA